METHACAVKNDGFLVNESVISSKSLLTLWHDGVMDKFSATNMIINKLWRCYVLGQTLDIVLTL